MNELLQLIGEKKVYKSSFYNTVNQISIVNSIIKKIFKNDKILAINREACICDDIIQEMKSVYEKSDNKTKIQILTVMPDRLSAWDISIKMECSLFMAEKSKRIKNLRGTFASSVTWKEPQTSC